MAEDWAWLNKIGGWTGDAFDYVGSLFGGSSNTAVPNPGAKGGDVKPDTTGGGGMSRDFLTSLLKEGVNFAGAYMQGNANREAQEEAEKRAARDYALRAKYGLLGGQGGGGGARNAALTDAYKTAIQTNQMGASAKGEALARLAAASARPLLR